MLSALITPEHSYPAMPRVRQLVHQRFVPPGPLVTISTVTSGVDYIFIPHSLKARSEQVLLLSQTRLVLSLRKRTKESAYYP